MYCICLFCELDLIIIMVVPLCSRAVWLAVVVYLLFRGPLYLFIYLFNFIYLFIF